MYLHKIYCIVFMINRFSVWVKKFTSLNTLHLFGHVGRYYVPTIWKKKLFATLHIVLLYFLWTFSIYYCIVDTMQ